MPDQTIDPRAVLHAIGIEAVAGPVPVTGGMDKAMWRFRAEDGRDYALRLYRAEEGERQAARREQAMIVAARAGGLPAPAVRAAGLWQERPALVLTWLPGRTLGDALESAPWKLWRLGVRMGRAQSRMHRVPLPSGFSPDEAHSWMNWPSSRPDLIERLRAHPPARSAIIHLDFHPLNVLTDGDRITGIVDWTNAATGDPRADIARTRAIHEVGPIPPSPLRPLIARIRRIFRAAWWHGYAERAGTPTDTEMAPFYAWAGATLRHDLAPRVGQFGAWLRPENIAAIDRWTARWERRLP